MSAEKNEAFSKETFQSLYACGYQFYGNGKYEEAIQVFRTLTLVQPDAQKNWMGLAASHQMTKDYERALEAYAFAATLDENNPLPHLHAAECLYTLGRFEDAQNALNSSEMAAKETKKNEILKHIELIRDAWSRRKK